MNFNMPIFILPILIFSSITFYGFGKLNDTLPLTLSNIFIFIAFLLVVLYSFGKKTFIYNKYYFLFFLFSVFSTVVNLGFNSDSFQFFLYYFIYSFTIFSSIYLIGVDAFFKLYVKFAIFLSVVAVLQVLGDFLGFTYINDIIRSYSENQNTSRSAEILRATSFASEPAVLGLYLLPVISLSVLNLLGGHGFDKYLSKRSSYLVLTTSLLTFSFLVYVNLVLICVYFILKSKNIFSYAIGFIILLSIIFLVSFSDSINERTAALSGPEQLVDSRHLSVFAVVSNYLVVKDSLVGSPLIGTGAVSHANKYDNLIHAYVEDDFSGLGLNRDDASSIYLRLLSEFGFFGLLLYLYLLNKGRLGLKAFGLGAELFLLSLVLYGIRYGSINIAVFWVFISCYQLSIKNSGVVKISY